MSRRFVSLFTVFAVLNFYFVDSAYAYLDPGSISFALQSILAAILSGLYFIKLYWVRIKAYFTKTTSAPEPSDETIATKEAEETN